MIIDMAIDPATIDRFSMTAYGFFAEFSAQAGGNIIAFRRIKDKFKILREPRNIRSLAKSPETFGVPVLFPVNRVANGTFTFRGKEYSLPVNETNQKNHIHGLVVNRLWELVEKSDDSVTFRYRFDENDSRFAKFPFAFELTRTITITPAGLDIYMNITNIGNIIMPVGMGYHTTFSTENLLSMQVGVAPYYIEIGKNFRPTGERFPWHNFNPSEPFIGKNPRSNFHAPSAPLFPNSNVTAMLQYPNGNVQYCTDSKFKFWYTHNFFYRAEAFSLEPTSWISNALNSNLSADEAGILELEPKQNMNFFDQIKVVANQ